MALLPSRTSRACLSSSSRPKNRPHARKTALLMLIYTPVEEADSIRTMVFHENVAARPTTAIVPLDAPFYHRPTLLYFVTIPYFLLQHTNIVYVSTFAELERFLAQ